MSILFLDVDEGLNKNLDLLLCWIHQHEWRVIKGIFAISTESLCAGLFFFTLTNKGNKTVKVYAGL